MDTQDAGATVVADIDFESNGKRVSRLTVTTMSNGRAAGFEIPIAVVKNGAGPAVWLNGGSHGDEYEGPVALTKLIQSLDPETITGCIIITPALNLPALNAGTRCSPVDGLDMNRSFPGRRDGTATMAIADYVHREILPRIDAVYDLHAGGDAFFVIPSVWFYPLSDVKLMAKAFAVTEALRLPLTALIEEPGRESMLDWAVESAGKIFICAELGGAGSLTRESLHRAEITVRNFLAHMGVIAGEFEDTVWRGRSGSSLVEVPNKDCYVEAERDGLYEPTVDLEDDVVCGDVIGHIHDAVQPEQMPSPVIAPVDGIVFFQRASGLVEKGNPTCVIARPLSRHEVMRRLDAMTQAPNETHLKSQSAAAPEARMASEPDAD